MSIVDDIKSELGDTMDRHSDLKREIAIQTGAAWNWYRDGQLFPTISMTPAQAFYNLAMKPGWQKWNPTFRHGTITALDENTASVTLENIKSSQQDLNINQAETLTGVEIDYMDCDGAAFAEGDEVLIMFPTQRFSNPKIIGFKENPKPCTFVIPYLFASEWHFPAGGLLLCHGGEVSRDKFSAEEFDENSLKFTEEFELFSPYGPTSWNPGSTYQPYEHDYQVQEYTDENGILWDEIPWTGVHPSIFFKKIQTSYTSAGEFYPDEYVTSGTDQLQLDGSVFETQTVDRWYVEEDDGRLHWMWSGMNMIVPFVSHVDESDPGKYAIIYGTYDWTADSYNSSYYSNKVETGHDLHFDGLGHTETISGWAGESTMTKTMRMYNVDGQYVCLFSIRFGSYEYVGCAIEGGSFTLTDVSGGIEYEGETRNVIAGATLGLIQRGGAVE